MTLAHILSIGFVAALTTLADKEAFAWMRGKKRTLDPTLLHSVHLLTWVGLISLITTGAVLFYPMRDYLLREPLFIMKILLVAVLLVNGVLIGRLMRIASERTFASLNLKEKSQLLISGGASFVGWTGALVLGLLLFY